MTVCDRGVKNHQKKRDILYGRPFTGILPGVGAKERQPFKASAKPEIFPPAALW